MIGIIDTNDRIHQALEIAPVKYVAERYSVLLEKGDEYALIIVELPLDWNPVIISTLTEDEKNSIQTLDSTWI